jgi:hypothetical protein
MSDDGDLLSYITNIRETLVNSNISDSKAHMLKIQETIE